MIKNMKTIYKKLMLFTLCFSLLIACSTEENPPYLSESSVYSSIQGIEAAVNGIYAPLNGNDYYGFGYHEFMNQTSGMFSSKQKNAKTSTLAFNITPTFTWISRLWDVQYLSISRANGLIGNVPEGIDDPVILNQVGQAYFLRAFVYFNLVRVYGGVPLRVDVSTATNMHLRKSTPEEVYTQIIKDATKAKELLFDNGAQTPGRPSRYAANMLLAKVYMTLAGNDNTSEYWQKAHDEAIEVYGKYTLVDNYYDLFEDSSTANNNSESIFEIQLNPESVTTSFLQVFSPSNYYGGKGWGRAIACPDVVDLHLDTYPEDPRIGATYLMEWIDTRGRQQTMYPLNTAKRKSSTGFSYIWKYVVKDRSAITSATNTNFVVYRYADLLLMLAEIENELNQIPSAITRVNEVLERARNSSEITSLIPSDWSSSITQEEFREAIMKEYRFELLAEGQDYFNNRRRGWDYFNENVRLPHNNSPVWVNNVDIPIPDNEDRVMLMPIPSAEINANQLITPEDQNPGY